MTETTTQTITTSETITTGERADLLETLANHRFFLRLTVRDLTDEQAAQRTTASELCLGGLIKHVADTERVWIDFVLGGTEAMASVAADWNADDVDPEVRLREFHLAPGETLAG